MEQRVSYLLVGSFVLILGTALIVGVLWLSAGNPRAVYDLYLTFTEESVSGLTQGATVEYKGVNVGEVRQIDIDPNNPGQVRLLLAIEQGTPIKTDTKATLQIQPLTGIATVNLSGSSRDAPPLQATADQPYPVIESEPSLLQRLDELLSTLIANLTLTSERLNEILTPTNLAAFEQTLENTEELTERLSAQSRTLAEILDDFAAVAGNSREVSRNLVSLVAKLEASASSLVAMSEELAEAGSSISKVAESSGRQVRRFTSTALPDAADVVRQLQRTAENLRRMSESLEQNPSLLLYGTRPPEAGPGE